MKTKLSRIRTPWRRLVLSLLFSCLWIVDLLFRLVIPLPRAHWIGQRDHRRRLQYPCMIAMFIAAMFLLEPHDYAVWAAIWGGSISIFLVFYTIYLFIPHKRADWIRQQ